MKYLDHIVDKLLVLLFGETDKEAMIVRELAETDKEKKTRQGQDDRQGLYVAGQQFVAGQEGEHVRVGVDKDLTAAEIGELLPAGIDLGKAAVVKSIKAGTNLTQAAVCAKLQALYGRGYSKSSVSPIWAILEKHSGGGASTPLPENGQGDARNIQLEVTGIDNQ